MQKVLLPFILTIILSSIASMASIMMVPTTLQILSLSLLAHKVILEETAEEREDTVTNPENVDSLDEELLPLAAALIGQYPHDFDFTPGFSRRNYAEQGTSRHSYSEQGKYASPSILYRV